MTEKTLYQVSFYHIYPGCTTGEDDAMTAFVEAISFDDARFKVQERYEKAHEHERAKVFGVAIAERCIIIY